MATAKDQVGFVGLGMMGLGMATNLQKYLSEQGQFLIVYNRTESRAESVIQLGAHLAKSVEEVARSCNVIFTSLSNDAAVEEVYNTILANVQVKNTVLVEMSTIAPQTVLKVNGEVSEKLGGEGKFVYCPVFGPPAAAKSAQLVVLAAGNPDARQKIKPMLVPTMGRALIDLGEEVEKPSKLKLIGNFFISSIVELIGEGLTLGEKSGLGEEPVAQFLQTFFPNTTFTVYADRIMKDGFVVDKDKGERALFSVELAKKDVGHILNLGKENGVDLPISEAVYDRLSEAEREFGSHYDFSSMAAVVRKKAGLPPTHQKQ